MGESKLQLEKKKKDLWCLVERKEGKKKQSKGIELKYFLRLPKP